MIGVRLKFIKGDEVKYISHLDLMRAFQRAIRRTNIPIKYSQGFNPHQEISFASPLGLGIISEAEYMDMELEEKYDISSIINSLNEVLPCGIRVIEGVYIKDGAKKAMSIVTHSRYIISFSTVDTDEKIIKNNITKFLEESSIITQKKQPKKNFQLKDIEIRPMIVQMELVSCHNNQYELSCLLTSGSKQNLKPELLMEAFFKYLKLKGRVLCIKKIDTYSEQDGKLYNLLEICKE